jgi:hypothetical protein
MDVQSDGVQGWSYGVLHDDTVLTILDATTDGTDAARIWGGGSFGFDATSHENVVTCATSEPSCPDPKPGGGFLSATVLSLRRTFELPAGKRSSIAFAEYQTTGKPFRESLIQFTDRMAAKGSPPAAINVTVAGNARLPETVVDGLIVRALEGEICDNLVDDDGDGLIDCIDEECCLAPNCLGCPCDDWGFYFGRVATRSDVDVGAGGEVAISMRNPTGSRGFELGVQAVKSGRRTRWQFSPFLGADINRLVGLLIADEEQAGHAPVTPNRLLSDSQAILDITRGAAIAGFSARDFLAVDLSPGVGGPGFTVGYLADSNPPPGQAGNLIPPPRAGALCPVNEILRVTLSLPPLSAFHRGDADGDGKFNVADAILLFQIRAGGLPARFDCEDLLDANDDGTADLADGIYLLNYLFLAGPELPAPFHACAGDRTADDLACAVANCP